VRALFKIFVLAIMVAPVAGCAIGGITGEGDAEGGKVTVPIQTVRYGQVCHSEVGRCFLPGPLVEGAACWCPTPIGPAYGSVGR
jgi:hypothetical protein